MKVGSCFLQHCIGGGGWVGFGGLAGLTVVGGLTASCSYIIPFAYAGRRGPCTIILLVIVY